MPSTTESYRTGTRSTRCGWLVSHIRATVAVLVLLQGATGCSDSGYSTFPTIPSTSEPPPSSPLSIVSISPNVGSTGGDTPLIIIGTGFESVSNVTLGGITLGVRRDLRDEIGTVMYLDSRPHASGPVDVVVRNSRGEVATLPGGYVYAPPESFDFNGSWGGFGDAGQDIPILFTIEGDRLTSVSCDLDATLTFVPPLPVTNGEFSYSSADGVAVSGRIVSATAAVGTINLAPCTATVFGVTKIATRE